MVTSSNDSSIAVWSLHMSAKISKLPAQQDKSAPRAEQSKGRFRRLRILAAGAVIIAAGLGAYHNGLQGPFIFDDIQSIPENPTIQRVWGIWDALSPPNDGQAVQRRPMVNLSLAMNYWVGGLEPGGYHIFNLSVHILTGLVLFGIVRRTLALAGIGQRFGSSSTGLSLAIALIWIVHPLQSEAVTYVIQRTELLAGLFYLLCLYCAIRSAGSGRKVWWYAAATLSCGLGMGSKEVMISAPLIILVYERIFLSRSFKDVFRRRWLLYIGLAATWGLLAALIPHGGEGTAVFGRGTMSLAYALTQFESISTYLRLCFWPSPLILDYGYFESTSLWRILPYAIFIISLLGATAWALRYRPRIGFLGLCFFSILAPSSSFVPLLRQTTAEKRMYLPLAAVVVLVVVCAYSVGKHILGRLVSSNSRRRALGTVLGCALVGIVVVILGSLTLRRNYDYQTEFSIWDDTVGKRPDNYRAYVSRGVAHFKKGRRELAIRDFDWAIKLNSSYPLAYNNRGFAYDSMGEHERAIRDFDKTIDLNPNFVEAHANRGLAYSRMGEQERAIRNFNRAIELNPRHTLAYNNRAIAYLLEGHYEQAILDFEKVIELGPSRALKQKNITQALIRLGWGEENVQRDWPEVLSSLAWILASHQDAEIRDGAQAVRLAQRACQLTGYKVPEVLDTLAAAYAELGQFEQAVKSAQRAGELARKAGMKRLAEDIQARMELYKAKQAYRELPGSGGVKGPQVKKD